MDKLGNYIEQIRGVSYKNNDVTDKHLEGYSVVLRANSIKDYKLSLENLVYVKNDLIKEKQVLKKYDILMAASSGSKEVVGKTVQILEDTDFSFGAFCKLIRCKKNINPKYVAYFFRTEEYRRTISHLVCGANINNIKNEHIDNLPIDVPSLDKQNQIVRILDQAQELIDKRKAQIEALDELIQSLFYDISSNCSSYSLYKLNDLVSEKKDIIDGPFGSNLKTSDYVDNGIRVIQINNIGECEFRDGNKKYINEEKYQSLIKHAVFPGDIIVAKMGEPLGRTCIVPSFIDRAVIVADCMRIKPNGELINSRYLEYLLNTVEVKRQFEKYSQGSTRIRLNLSMLREVELKVIPLELQNQFAEIVESIEKQKELLNESLVELENNFNSLMQRAFIGVL